MLNLPPSNFSFPRQAYGDIIQNERDTDQTGNPLLPFARERHLYSLMVLLSQLPSSLKTIKLIITIMTGILRIKNCY